MRNLTRFACLTAAVGMSSLAFAQQAPDAEVAPFSPVFKTATPGPSNGSYLALGDHRNFVDVETPSADNGCLGVEMTESWLYVAGRDAAAAHVGTIYKFDAAGALNNEFVTNSSGVSTWGHRDLDSNAIADGAAATELYGGEENGWFAIYDIDASGDLTNQGALSIVGVGTVRALTHDAGTGNFYTCSFGGPVFEFDNAGNVIQSFGNPGLAGVYGAASNPIDADKVWFFSQDGPNLVQVSETSIAAGFATTGLMFDALDSTGTVTTGIAGGLSIADEGLATYSFYGLSQGTPDQVNSYDSNIVSGTATTKFCTAKTGLVCGTPSISASGSSSATATSGFTVSAGPARDNRSGILMYNNQGTVAGLPFNGGTLCVNPMAIRRAGSTNSQGSCGPIACAGTFTIDMNSFGSSTWAVPDCTGANSGIAPNNAAPFLTVPGTTVDVQYWGRDSVATGSFVSDGLSWTVGP